MKIKLFLLFLLSVMLSCEVEPFEGATNENPSNPVNSSAEFKVDFNSQTWVANSIQAIVNSDYIAITGLKTSGEFFQITIPDVKVGTYTLDMSTTSSVAFGLIYSSGSGNVPYLAANDENGEFSQFPNYTDTAIIVISNIDTVNKQISGTFQFTGVRFVSGSSNEIETKVFTNGVFNNISYKTDVVAPTGNSFFAKLDGTDFIPSNINGFKMSGFISVIGRKGNIENIGLSIPENVTSGTTLTFDAFSSNVRGQYIDANSGIFGGDGTMTIISHDVSSKRIKGTFSFTANTILPPTMSHTITQGSFEVTYQ